MAQRRETPTGLAEESVLPGEEESARQLLALLAGMTQAPGDVALPFPLSTPAATLRARFVVAPLLPDALRVGAFRHPFSYDAWVRFASSGAEPDADRAVRKLAIKLLGVEGDHLTPGETAQVFLLSSYKTPLARDAEEYCRWLRDAVQGGLSLRLNPFDRRTKALRAARRRHSSYLTIPYYSGTAILFGPGQAAKYAVQPAADLRGDLPKTPAGDYLYEGLRRQLSIREVRFDFMAQLQTDPERMPIEDAWAEWSEAESPYRTVATLIIPRQHLDAAEQQERARTLEFNPWHGLAEHRPLGSLNRLRRYIYPVLAAQRRAAGSHPDHPDYNLETPP